jgi:hypothetical protein
VDSGYQGLEFTGAGLVESGEGWGDLEVAASMDATTTLTNDAATIFLATTNEAVEKLT